MYENSRFLKNRFTFCGVNTKFGQQWAPPAYYHLTPIVSKGKHWDPPYLNYLKNAIDLYQLEYLRCNITDSYYYSMKMMAAGNCIHKYHMSRYIRAAESDV